MDIKNLELYQKKLKQISQHQLVGIYLDSFLSSLNLEFTNGTLQKDKIIRFTQIMSFAISKTPEDDEGCFIVGEINVDFFDGQNKNIILLKNIQSDQEEKKGFHFYLDGDIRLELFFYHMDIFEN